jgi:hypothetical protein
MQDNPTAITATAACELGRHDRCKGRIVSLTGSHGQPCACPTGCHDPLPDPDEELELAREAVAELALERELERAHGWWS